MSFTGLLIYKVNSTRCPNKHSMLFADGMNLIQLKIKQLLDSGASHVYVSTDDTTVTNTENVTYVMREPVLCDESKSTWKQSLTGIFNQMPIDDDEVIVFCTAMIPLFSRFDEMYEHYKKTNIPLISVHASKHYYMNEDKHGINFSFGDWHPYSQGIKSLYQHSCAATMAPMKAMRETGYMFPAHFDYFNMDVSENLDIDTKDEFELAQVLYEWNKKKKLEAIEKLNPSRPNFI